MAIAQPLLFGRSREIARLSAALERSRDGSARVIVLDGDPGIGKSALLDALATIAVEHGYQAYRGRARELERERPFHPLAESLDLRLGSADPERAAVARLLLRDPGPVEGDFTPGPALRYQLSDAITELVGRLAADTPVLLALDDVQWADTATFEVVQAAVLSLPTAPVLVALACRRVPARSEIASLEHAVGEAAEHMTVEPLDADACAALVEAVTGSAAGPTLRSFIARTGGNPFFLREVVSVLRDDGLIDLRDGRAEVRPSQLPPSLQATIIRRLGFLPDHTLALLRVGAVLGSAFAVQRLALVSGRRISQVVDAIEPALRAGILIDDEGRLAFRHDLVHEAVVSDQPRAIREAVHLEVARTLAADGAVPLEVAPHFMRGVVGRSLEGAGWVRRAAAAIASRSPSTAAELLRRAIEMTARDDELRLDCQVDLVRVLLWAGRWADAEALAREVLEMDPRSARSSGLHYVLARSFIYRGRTRDSIEETERALAAPDQPAAARARLLADLSLRRPLIGDLEGGAAAARAAIELGAPDDRLTTRTAQSGLALVAALRGEAVEAVRIAREAVPSADDAVAEAVEFVQPHYFLSIALVEADQFDEATQILRAVRGRAEEMGLSWAAGLAGILLANVGYITGRWSDAAAEAEAALAACDETGTRVWSLLGLGVLTTIAARQGDVERARSALGAGAALVAETGLDHLGIERWLRARAAFRAAEGDAEGAFADLEGAWSEIERRGFRTATRDIGPLLVGGALAARRPELATAVAAQVGAAPAEVSSVTAVAELCRGLLARDGHGLAQALDALRGSGRVVTHAEACELAGAVLATSAAEGQSRPLAQRFLLEASELYLGMDANVDVARVEGRLRALGVRRGAKGSRRRPTVGWASLTPTELAVAELAGQGLTNREIGGRLFVSHRTIATHLEHIFAKTGVGSRVELAAAIARRST